MCAAVAACLATPSSATRCTIQDASVAVINPTRPMPPIISKTAMSRPVGVKRVRSPYPTVVVVVMDHHTAWKRIETLFASHLL